MYHCFLLLFLFKTLELDDDAPNQGSKNSGNIKLGGIAPSNLEIALIKQYPFDSAVQRMTVVAKKKGAQYYSVFVKGAPEKVASFCRPDTSKF